MPRLVNPAETLIGEIAHPRTQRAALAGPSIRLLALFIALRPAQWTKNLFVFAGLIFGQRLLDLPSVLLAFGAFVVFCFLSGVVYLINDVADRETDRQHPLKGRRPVASGALPVWAAVTAAVLLAPSALALAYWLSPALSLVASIYVGLLALYSARLKHVVIIDVLTIAIGFVLRAVAGAVVIAVPISMWLLVCTTLLALFLALSKRRQELQLLADGAQNHRRILGEYSPYLLDQMIGVVTASTLIAYVFYAISAETQQKFGTDLLALTIPAVLYGIFRYLYLVHQKREGGSPADLLLTDRPLLVCVALWAAAVVAIIYYLPSHP